jgi:heme exporter protein D
MEQISSFLHLGGYGAYVWPAYGVAAVILIGLLWHSLASLRAGERLQAQLQKIPAASDRTSPANTPRHEAAR